MHINEKGLTCFCVSIQVCAGSAARYQNIRSFRPSAHIYFAVTLPAFYSGHEIFGLQHDRAAIAVQACPVQIRSTV